MYEKNISTSELKELGVQRNPGAISGPGHIIKTGQKYQTHNGRELIDIGAVQVFKTFDTEADFIGGAQGNLYYAKDTGLVYEYDGSGFIKVGSSADPYADYVFDDSTTTSPASGELRFNNIDPVLTTKIYASTTAQDSIPNIDNVLDTPVSSLLYIKSITTETIFVIEGIQDQGTYFEIDVEYLNSTGTLADLDSIEVRVQDLSEKGGVAWHSSINYVKGDIVTENDIIYLCNRNHLSSTTNDTNGSPSQPSQTGWFGAPSVGVAVADSAGTTLDNTTAINDLLASLRAANIIA